MYISPTMPSNLVPYELPEPTSRLLSQAFAQPCRFPELQPTERRPRPLELRSKIDLVTIKSDRTSETAGIKEAIYRSINRSWEAYAEGFVGPSDFLRTPFGASFQLVTIEGKGRGIIASQDIKAGEVILEESPLVLAPKGTANMLLFLLLPQKAVEAALLLHNAFPGETKYTARSDIPLHRLLDALLGIMSTNSFDGYGPYGNIGILLLTGSLFNHSDTQNIDRHWNATKEKEVFMASRDIKKGEELVHDYVPGLTGAARAERLKLYGI
ncbi:hypothetical protein F4778DRAFT_766636 [Xylariomycetidae sp. FL2044]|nr:hypothetical protein F4778DRAFT_766636 [Xylariomycetidae sp. FL2044]